MDEIAVSPRAKGSMIQGWFRRALCQRSRSGGCGGRRADVLAAVLVMVTVSQQVLGELDLSYRVDELDIEPAVQVKQYPNRTVEEYRINGNLYMIRIKPKFGAPYYLVDDSGTGELEFRRDDPSRPMVVPRWTLKTW